MRKYLSAILYAFCIMSANADSLSTSGIVPSTSRVLSAKSVNLSATGDQATIAIPPSITKYAVTAVWVTNCSVTPILAQVSMFTGAGGTGTTVVAAGTITGATSAPVILPQSLAGTVSATALTSSSLFVRVSVANVAALTCDVYTVINDLS